MPAPPAGEQVYVLWPGRPFCCFLPSKRTGSPVVQGVLVSRTVQPEMPSRSLFHGQFTVAGQTHTLAVFIDSGADASFMDNTLAAQLGIDRVPPTQAYPCRRT